MKVTDSTAAHVKLVEDLLSETKKLCREIKDLETQQENSQEIIDAQNVVIRRYREAFERLPYGIYMKNADMKYLYCNEGFAKLFNRTMMDVLGGTDREILSQESADQFSACEQKVWYLGQIMEGEETHVVNGEERMLFVSRRLLRGEASDIASLLGVFIDITETRRQEEQWKQNSLEQSRQIESLKVDLQRADNFAKQQEADFKLMQAGLEEQISELHVELEKRNSELQQKSEERKRAAHLLMSKVSDIEVFIASTKRFLDTSGKAS